MKINSVQNKISFGAENQSSVLKSDDEIIVNACRKAISKTQNNFTTKAQKAIPYLMMGAFAIGTGVKTPGKISQKAFNTARLLGFYAAANGFLDIVFGAKNKIEKKRGDEKNTAVTTLAALAIGLGGVYAIHKGINKTVEKIVTEKPKWASNIVSKVQKTFNSLNDSKLAKSLEKLRPHYNKFVSNHPKLTAFVSKNFFPITMTGGIVSEVLLSSINNKKREEIFKNELTRNVIKRDIIAKNQI